MTRITALPAGKLVELADPAERPLADVPRHPRGPAGPVEGALPLPPHRRHQSYRFRARLPREASYPFAAGRTRTVAVTVRGR